MIEERQRQELPEYILKPVAVDSIIAFFKDLDIKAEEVQRIRDLDSIDDREIAAIE